MIERAIVDVDVDHILRCGATISGRSQDLVALIGRLSADIADGPQWNDEFGGDVFTPAFARITALLLNKLGTVATDMDDLGAHLQQTATDLEAADERAGVMVRKSGRGL